VRFVAHDNIWRSNYHLNREEIAMSKKHTFIMIACCVIGMGGVAAIFLFKLPVNSVLVGLMLLVCPLSHLLMMSMMGKQDQQHHETTANQPISKSKTLTGR
jgi:hypothetical protein